MAEQTKVRTDGVRANGVLKDEQVHEQDYRRVPFEEPNSLVLLLGGYEGPLDLLLGLARQKRVDLQHISIKSLAEQYLAFIARAKDLHLAIKAEYLVMAVHLARMKARLLLPRDNAEATDAATSAEALRENLLLLDRARETARLLRNLARLGSHFFSCGVAQKALPETIVDWEVEASLFELLQSYAKIERRRDIQAKRLHIRAPHLYDSTQASLALEPQLDEQWRDLLSLVPVSLLRQAENEEDSGLFLKSIISGFFSAALDLTNFSTRGKAYAELQQPSIDSPLQIRLRADERTNSGLKAGQSGT